MRNNNRLHGTMRNYYSMGPLPSKPWLQSSFFSVCFTKNLSLNVFTEYNIFSYMLLIKEGDICCLPNRLMALKS